jgi:hypothetical protein
MADVCVNTEFYIAWKKMCNASTEVILIYLPFIFS